MSREQVSELLGEALAHLRAINAVVRRLLNKPTAGVKPHGDCPNIIGNARDGYSCRIGCGEQCEHPAGVKGGDDA